MQSNKIIVESGTEPDKIHQQSAEDEKESIVATEDMRVKDERIKPVEQRGRF